MASMAKLSMFRAIQPYGALAGRLYRFHPWLPHRPLLL